MIREPLPRDPLGQKLCSIFGTYRWMTIEGDTDDATVPNWRTVDNYPLRPRSLWQRWQDAAQLVGVRFGNTTTYALLDIDAGSDYLSRLDDIKAVLETIGIVRTVAIRSSWNGGLHLYIPLPDVYPTFDVACSLKYCLESQGFKLAEGQLETFPNVKSYAHWWKGQFSEYHAHRLPLQPGSGSAMLNQDYQPISGDLSRFFWSWQFAARSQDVEALGAALKHGRDQHRKRPKLRSHPVDRWRLDLEAEIEEGWSDHGQTNGLLKSIACYGRVFERLAGQELIDYTVRIAVSRPGFEQWCKHQAQIQKKATAWARAAEKYYWPLGDVGQRDKECLTINYNAVRAQEAVTRIKEAVIQLATSGQLLNGVAERARQIARVARASLKTIYKNSTLWHPEQWCVIAQPAGDTADSREANVDPSESLKPSRLSGITHLPDLMKGVRDEARPEKAFTPGGKGGCRGDGGYPQADGGVL